MCYKLQPRLGTATYATFHVPCTLLDKYHYSVLMFCKSVSITGDKEVYSLEGKLYFFSSHYRKKVAQHSESVDHSRTSTDPDSLPPYTLMSM